MFSKYQLLRKPALITLLASLMLSMSSAWAQTNQNGGTFNLPHITPSVDVTRSQKVSNDISVILDGRINYVPNIGIIEGKDAILVIDTGMGRENGEKVFSYARKIAGNRRIFVTTTHFHPEHAFGASAFKDAIYVANRKQAQELKAKGQLYLEMFIKFGPVEKEALKDASLVQPALVYDKRMTLDLGGKQVELLEMPAHTQGDQVIYADGVVFLGDLVENRFFPIMPDADSNGEQWIKVMNDLIGLKPTIVVPGHGALGDIGLIKEVRDYLITVRKEVEVFARNGQSQDQALKALTPKLKALHPDWDNSVFVPYEISNFYSLISGKPLQLPTLLLDMQK